MAKSRFYNFLGAYNKAYKSKNIDEKDFNSFLKNLRDFFAELETVDKTNEELLKGVFNKHLLKNYTTLLNENRIDLSIKKDNKTQVIFEFKFPNNKAEMLQDDSEDVNKKALQEAIWYFYNQDSKEISYNIKNVVITDTEHLFFFNPKQFCNKDLEKICLQFRNNQVAYTDTKTLYDQIGAKIIEKCISFDYAEFNLIQYKSKILNNSLNDNDLRQLKYLYKALHPDFLLREYSPKDSNELNSKFYNELLYILGLKEEGKNQKKIVASDIKGTLRDRISYDLNCNRFDDVINLIIVWLNRLLFLKLFESQLISFNDNNKTYAFLNFDKIPTFAKLNRLFFNVLGKPLDQRDEHEIPYLNSSLFERSELESKYGNISNLDSEITLPLCKGSILSKVKNYPQNPTLLKYLLDFLEAYSFSSNITENDDKKDIINSSVLGLIFEKLNGYKDGSFFTPAYITEYMAETSINNIVLQKFNKAFGEEKAPCNTIEDLKSLISYDVHIKERRDFYNEIIDSLKICDPAVGSGHFLVSVLNYIVALKSELGLLHVRNKVEIQNDSLVIYEQDGETQFEYKRNNQESLTVQKAIFDEKRKIIENCLFGVDINPNSVQICCLRLWIELLKNTYYIGNTDEMQILPNIDINIKCGNSLVSAYEVKVGHCALESLDGRTAEAKSIKEYKNLVAEYKNTESKISKSDLKDQIKTIKNKIFPTRQLSLFEQNNNKGVYQNSMEWMIEFPELLDENGVFNGFDIVIANPPYMRIQKIQETQPVAKEFYENDNYITAHGSYDLANLFIELSLRLIHKNSTNIFIFPHKFLNSSNGEHLREYLLNNHYVDKITHFGANMIFSSADTYTCILQYSKKDNNGIYFRKFPFKSSFISQISNEKLFNFIPYEFIKQCSKLYGSNQWILFNTNTEFNIFEKIYKNNNENIENTFSDVFVGLQTSGDDIYLFELIREYDNKYLLKIAKRGKEYEVEKDLFKPILKGQDVHKYEYLKTNKYVFFPYKIIDGEAKIVNIIELQKDYPLTYQYVMDNEQAFKKRESGKASKLDTWYAYIYPKNLNKFEQIKLSSMEICSNHPNVSLNTNNLYHTTTIYSFIKNEHVTYSYEYLLSLLNSKVLWWFLKNTGDTLQGDARRMKTEYLKPFPLPVRNENLEHNIENLVKQIFEEKQKVDCNNTLCEQYENEINQIVYKLYELTEDERNFIGKL